MKRQMDILEGDSERNEGEESGSEFSLEEKPMKQRQKSPALQKTQT